MAGKFWREAATLMVVGRAPKLNSKIASQDFKLLFLKRNTKTSFMPNSYVFPGGVIDPSDFSKDWLEIFKKCGYESSDLLREFRKDVPQQEIYLNKPYHIIPEVGFRIGAIRETFEECGLLLMQHLSYKNLHQHELTKWQKTVHQDASQFVVMFQELGGCPDIWSLHEWMTWLTPSHQNHRFDTAFFITFLEKIPKIVADDKEVVDVKVAYPIEILKQWHDEALMLPPPQLYELSRLLNVDSYDELQGFAEERGQKGMDHFYPVRIITRNGIIMCLPGDDLYPEEPDYTGEQGSPVLEEPLEKLRSQGQNFHRMVVKGPHDVEFIMNVTPKSGHKAVMNFIKLLKTKSL